MPRNTCADYKKHLENVFHYLSYNSDVASGCPKINEYASQACKRLQLQVDPSNWALKIGPWQIPITDNDDNFRELKALLSVYGVIKAENSKLASLTFSVGILLPTNSIMGKRCRCSNKRSNKPLRLVRLFRFESGIGNTKTAETSVHVHYGGDPHESLTGNNYFNCLENWIKKPRIPFPPYDVTLFLEVFFRQFDVGVNAKFFSEPYWLNCVQSSEKFLLKGYYERIAKYFGQEKNSSTLLGILCSTNDLLT